METEVETDFTVLIQQFPSSLPLLITFSDRSSSSSPKSVSPPCQESFIITFTTNIRTTAEQFRLVQISVSPTPYVPPSKKDYEILAVDPVGSPSTTTKMDRDEQSTILISHKSGNSISIHTSRRHVLHEMMSDHNIQSTTSTTDKRCPCCKCLFKGLVPQGQKVSDYDNSDPVPPRQNVVPTAEKIDSSQQGLDHPLEQVRGNPNHPVQTRRQLAADPEMCYVLTSRGLLKNKNDEDQSVIRNKTRLVAKGYAQEEGIDFEESFAPVATLGKQFRKLLPRTHKSFSQSIRMY
ncbi:retrovirus-related pol polyprotein from transposon TNT 1-94 [Tanacetum coccineum]